MPSIPREVNKAAGRQLAAPRGGTFVRYAALACGSPG